MGMFSWLQPSKRRAATTGEPARMTRSDRKAVTVELSEWANRRRGVEVFVEPKTAVTETSVVLVAHDVEFTRRRIASRKAAQAFAHDNSRRETILRQRMDRDALVDCPARSRHPRPAGGDVAQHRQQSPNRDSRA